MRRRNPITFWALAALVALFFLTEVYFVVQLALHPCPPCSEISDAIIPITALVFLTLTVPVAVIGLLLDALRHRRLDGRRDRTTPRRLSE